MEEGVTVEPTAEEPERLRKEIAQFLAEIRALREQMRADQAEIEKSRARTEGMLARLDASSADSAGRSPDPP